jgi:hypothetical protein
MILSKYALMVVLAVFASQSLATDDFTNSQEELRDTIVYLTQRVAEADVVFIRNSKEYTPAEAAKHMTRKYEHFKEKIQSPEDFIRLTATKSVVSGKPYLVRMKDGRTIPCAEWLHGILRDYRVSQD